MIGFTQLALPINVALFLAAAAAVWFSGSHLTRYADAISEATGLGQAVVGMVLLAGITSLPEIGVTVTVSLDGQASLAVNNLVGSIALQVALLAIVDFFIGRRALTAVVPEPAVILEGSFNIILLGLIAAAMVVGDVAVLGIGAWAWGALLSYVACVWILSRTRGKRPWLAARHGKVDQGLLAEQRKAPKRDEWKEGALGSLIGKTAAVGVVILIAGYVLARSGEAIAEQSGLGTSFVGFVLLAFATSLPELSSALAAARRGLYTMAISDILGTNLINIGLIFVVDALSSGEPVLSRMDSFAVFGTLLALVLTGLYQAGLAERRDESVMRMGYDSILVTVAYVGGVVILYSLRPNA